MSTDNLLSNTPMVKSRGFLAPSPDFRMDAYYYSFEPTGILAIDRILSAMACAGKAYHSTEEWREDCQPYEAFLTGHNPVEWIQNAANEAADAIRSVIGATP